MAVHDERWRLVVTWAEGKRAGQEHAAYPLIGLDERTVCRLLGFRGAHVPRLPVEVADDRAVLLQPYAARSITTPNGTTAELFLDRDASSAADILPLMAVAGVAALVAVGLWWWAGSVEGWPGTVLHLVAIAAGLLTLWSLVSAFLVMMVVRSNLREQLAAQAAADRTRRRR